MDNLSEELKRSKSVEIKSVVKTEEIQRQNSVLEKPVLTNVRKEKTNKASGKVKPPHSQFVQNIMDFHKITEEYLKSTSNSKEMAEVLSSITQFRKMMEHSITPSKEDDKEAYTKRHLEILTFYAEVVLEKCSNYMLLKKPWTSSGKMRYERVKFLFRTTYQLKHILGNRIFYLNNTEKPLFNDNANNGEMKISDFLKSFNVAKAGDDYSELKNDETGKKVTFKNRKSAVIKKPDANSECQYTGVFLAKYLGINGTVTDFHQIAVKDENNKTVEQCVKGINTGSNLGELKAKSKKLIFSEEAYEQLFRIQIMDILTGNTRDPNNLEVHYDLSKEKPKEEIYIDKIIGDGNMINFTTQTDMHLENFNFKYIDPKIVSNLKALNSNKNLIKSFGLKDEVLEAFKLRLSALIQKIDEVTQRNENTEHNTTWDIFVEKKWEYNNDSILDKLKLTRKNAGVLKMEKFNNTVGKNEKITQISNSQLKIGFLNNRELKRDNKPGFGKSLLGILRHASTYVVGLPSLIIKKGTSFIAGCFAKLTNVGTKDIIRDRIPGKLNIDDSVIDTQTMKNNTDAGEDNQDVIEDKRMLPLTFEESVPIGEEEPPYISLKIEQPKEGSEQITNESVGHAMIEIEYTRLDKKSGKKRRYRSQFGFYPKGGFSNFGTAIGMTSNGMVMPGVILNDRGHDYHVGRRFRATNKQINKMILFTNDYAQNGGYNNITRSCSTFTVEALNHVGIDTKGILQKDVIDVQLTDKMTLAADAVIPISVPLSIYYNFGQRKKGKRDDLSYQRVGQKMLTQKEYERLFATNHSELKGYTPAFLAENLRALKSDDDNDLVMSRTGYSTLKWTIRAFIKDISEGKNHYIEFIKNEFKDELDATILNHIDDNLLNLLKDLEKFNDSDILKEDAKPLTKEKALEKKNKIKELSEILSKLGQFVSKTYNVILKRDKRANIETHHFISNIEILKDQLISEYSDFGFEMLISDQNDMVKQFSNATYFVGENKAEQNQGINYNLVELTALCEAYGDYKTAVQNLYRLDLLTKKKGKTESEFAEINNIKRHLNLIKPFLKAHMYYFESKTLEPQFANMAFFSIPKISQDMRFRFVPPKKEDDIPDIKQKFREPAQFYQSIAFSKIFSESLPDKSKFSIDNPVDYLKQFDEKADSMAVTKSEEFNLILEAIYKGNPEINKDEFCNKFQNCILDSFLRSELATEFDSQASAKKINIESHDAFMDIIKKHNISLDKLKQRVGYFYDSKQGN